MSATTENTRRDFGTLRLRGRIWWLRYRVNGKEHWESSRSPSKKVAEKLLVKRETELGHNLLIAPDVARVTFADLQTMLRNHYAVKGLKSLRRVEGALVHLRATFGNMKAIVITADRIGSYEADRLAAKASRSTVNYELAILRKMFNIAIKAGRLTARPIISTPSPKNARTGFFEPEDFEVLKKELPEYLRAPMTFAYLTGWRVPSEVLQLTWDRVDFRAGIVRLNVNATKTNAGRVFPFDALPQLAELLWAQRDHTSVVERERGTIVAHVFHNNGRPIRNHYHAWRSALKRAAKGRQAGHLRLVDGPDLAGRVAHDFRRTAVRNLVRAGVPERVAMELTGHKTREVFDRYNITNEADLREGVSKLSDHLSGKTPKGTTGGQSEKKSANA